MEAGIIVAVVIVLIALVLVGRSIKTVQQYEDGIIFRFGRVLPGIRGAGLTLIRPIGDKLVRVNKQIIAMGVPAQDGITRDNVTVRVDAVVYFRVVDPIKASINVFNYQNAISQRAQTSLRSIIGQSEMDVLLAERETVNRRLCQIIDEGTEIPWGVKVESVEIKDVSLPEGMKRSMSRQAEAERERRARIITADGEFQASKRLAAAATVMSRDPGALQLRLLQTVVEVAAERNSTLVMPVPVELLRFFDKFTPGGPAPEEPAEDEEPGFSAAGFSEAALGAKADTEAQTAANELREAAEEPLEIPEVPKIPELSAAEKGDVGTHHDEEAAEPEGAGLPAALGETDGAGRPDGARKADGHAEPDDGSQADSAGDGASRSAGAGQRKGAGPAGVASPPRARRGGG
ncbi:MAG TPA: slipin family protein [Streptosporangiaceae bacterium]|jgi:regulator of protease activity HflC (stomatin/prohibitin superfamily)